LQIYLDNNSYRRGSIRIYNMLIKTYFALVIIVFHNSESKNFLRILKRKLKFCSLYRTFLIYTFDYIFIQENSVYLKQISDFYLKLGIVLLIKKLDIFIKKIL